MIRRRNLFRGVWYLANLFMTKQCHIKKFWELVWSFIELPEFPNLKFFSVPQGIRPRGATFEFGYLRELETEFEKKLGYDRFKKKKPEVEILILLSI